MQPIPACAGPRSSPQDRPHAGTRRDKTHEQNPASQGGTRRRRLHRAGSRLGAGHHPASAANSSVSIADFAFAPGTVTVSAGDTVTWTNNDAGVPHTVSSDSGGDLASGQLSGGESYQKTFSTAGSYAYHCDIHPSMTGLVVVTGAAATATSTPAPTNTPAATTAAATATLAATNTPAAAATATSPAAATATPTAASTASPAGDTTPGPTPPAAPSPTTAPQPPATGDGDAGDSDTATVVASGVIAIAIVLAVGAAVYLVRRRRV
ncbi:MAG: cupredoxin family copper-binding protein [Dehalococcoidia bacterium]|nr:cupredoxin family copper-binding protein [Dehalococcoidia bacterium]